MVFSTMPFEAVHVCQAHVRGGYRFRHFDSFLTELWRAPIGFASRIGRDSGQPVAVRFERLP
jgi:hypothetical protein